MSDRLDSFEEKVQEILVGVYKGGYAMKGSVDIKEFGELMKDGGFDPQIGANEIRQLAEAEVDKARRIPDPDRYSRRLKRLKRRRDWLKSQSDSTPDRTDIGYTRAELSALNWAIEILEGLNPRLNTQESEES